MKKRVAVLMGGWSAEREVSLVTGRAVAKGLEAAGYEVTAIDARRDVATVLAALTPRPDVVFNALHGRYGEDGCVQGVLEILGVPYTHSGPLASALAMNKPMAKRLLDAAGVPTAEGIVVHREATPAGPPMDPPFVVKPINEGSSVGVRIVGLGDNRATLVDDDFRHGDAVLVERYVPGREITVAVMGDRALGVTEIRPRLGFYDYKAKYTEGVADHLVPAPIHRSAFGEAQRISVLAHRTLGCRGVSRADLRYDDTAGEPGRLYLLEVNTQPGMTPLSLVPEQAAAAGIDFPRLVSWMVEEARCDT
ncbi:MAG: D-alanine--D-alanine ligase [Alphaproteobacteria bacterium]|nr:D-alanine--D-alanine ligase [Alphaproteobacteria bacterium]